MLALNNIGISFSGKPLLSGIGFMVNRGERVGLAGKNGAGKSTLLKIIAGQVAPAEGIVSMPSGSTIGYLPQEMEHQQGRTVMQEAMTNRQNILDCAARLHRLENQIANSDGKDMEAMNRLLHQLANEQDRYSHLGGYQLEGDAEKIMLGLGFKREELDDLSEHFSGGWRMRIELGKLLLQQPDLLLLDEPTNHLDIESIRWLEEYLQDYGGAIIIISHDKRFLDRLTRRTIEIVKGKVYDYKASYSKFRVLRAERIEQQKSAQENQQKQIAQTERFIERFRAKNTKATQVQSRVKQLEKLDIIEIDEEDFSRLMLRFPPAPRAGAVVVEAKGIHKSYGEKKVLTGVDFHLSRGEKVAFVGKNGEGKSTMARIVAGLEPAEGHLKLGHNVSLGFFAQNQADTLNPAKTVFETIDDEAVGEMRTKVRSLLGAFMFSGEDVDKQVRVLSGGEKARLAMARLLLESHNLLVLDEPTNHLDIASIEVLQAALQNYDGAMIIVSHDRDFLAGLVTRSIEFRNGKTKEYLGDINDWITAKQKAEQAATAAAKPTPKPKAQPQKAEVPQENREERKKRENQRRKLERDIQQSEEAIGKMEARIVELEHTLANDPRAAMQADLLAEYQKLQADLARHMKNWEEMGQALEKL